MITSHCQVQLFHTSPSPLIFNCAWIRVFRPFQIRARILLICSEILECLTAIKHHLFLSSHTILCLTFESLACRKRSSPFFESQKKWHITIVFFIFKISIKRKMKIDWITSKYCILHPCALSQFHQSTRPSLSFVN